MESVANRLKRFFTFTGSELHIGGLPVSELAECYGTPFFVYDRAILDSKLSLLRNALPREFEVYYSVKANPNPAILRHFVLRGCGLEVASEGEILQARAADCPANRIVFAGPGKTDKELELAINFGIGELHVESQSEAARIASICRRRGLQVRVAVRVNPTGEGQGGAMRMGGKAAPFGTDEEKLDPLVRYLSADACFEFRGIHMFSGTQILDYGVLALQYRKCIQIARRVAETTRQPLRTVDFGGGLGVPYFEGEVDLDLDRFKGELTALIGELRNDPLFQGTRFLVEPGRFLVAEAGIYVSRILDIKESRNKKFLIIDGGMNHHLAASGNLGQTIKRNYPILLLNRAEQPAEETVDVVGPLCTPLDTIGRGVGLPKAEIGDLIGILQSGAYARAASPLGFLSHPTPAEVWVDHEDHCLIRSRGQAGDAMRDTFIPSALAVQV
jgi:diaminopimelate decarboxylase